MKLEKQLLIKQKQKGFTLVELLLVVGLIALGAVVAYITFPKVQSTSRANAEATNINTIASGINNLYAGSNTFTGLTNEVLINGKGAPERMVGAGNTLVNSLGGAVTIGTATLPAGGVTDNHYQITWEGIPEAECVKLGTGVANNFVDVTINGTAVKTYPGEEVADPVTVTTACDQGGANILVFRGR